MSNQFSNNYEGNHEESQNNGFWKEWFQNSEAALERDKDMILQTLEDLKGVDVETVLREFEDFE